MTRSAWTRHHPSVAYLDVMTDGESFRLGLSLLNACDKSIEDTAGVVIFSLGGVIEC